MPFLSSQRHLDPFVERLDKNEQMSYLYTIVAAFRHCSVPDAHKKRFLREAIWKVTHLNRDFFGRYRSEGVISAPYEQRIERDHVIRKEAIMRRLLLKDEPLPTIFKEVIHCVTLKKEHLQLTQLDRERPDIDGWDRYRACGIIIYDYGNNAQRIT
jgi:hypothetical protein